jgi:pantetheine-phosphate adenylyltransferase
MKKAIYAGSFDPITNGHIDIINRALSLFDEVLIAVIYNPNKNALFTIKERIDLIKKVFKNNTRIEVEGFEGLLVEFAYHKKIFTLIRGLRAVSDFDYEFQMALMNRKLQPKIDTVFLMTDQKYSYLSSSLVKQIAHFNADISDLIPAEIKKALKDKFK